MNIATNYTNKIKNKFNKNNAEISWNKIFNITWPSFFELVLSGLFGMVDMMMVGKLGPTAITAVGLTNQPFMILLCVFAAINVGTTTLVAWNIGAKKFENANSVVRQAIIINLILGLIMSFIGFSLSKNIVAFMGAKEDTIKNATIYFKIISSGLFFQSITLGITASLRGAGLTKIPMYYNISSNLINVFGNYVLIYGRLGFPEMGTAGAALSTTFSRFLSCLFGLYVLFFYNKTVLKLKITDSFKLDKYIIRKILSIGIPSSIEQFVLQSGLVLYARSVSSLGTQHYAAHQIGLNISSLTFSPSMAFGVAATTLVGQSLGENDKTKAEKYANLIHCMALAVGGIMGIVFILFSYPLAKLYTDDLQVAVLAGTILKIMALTQPGQSTQLSLAGALRGAGDTMYPLYASIFGVWIFRVIAAYLFVLVFNFGLLGAWFALLLDQYTRAIVIYLRFKSGKWKYIKEKKQKKQV